VSTPRLAGRRLRRSDCGGAGIHRRRRGRGFSYEDADGERIEDEETLQRIRELAIPPAWEDVWACADPIGHIQATGFDEAGRKQYRYHDRWEQRRAARKYESMREFARLLPRLRRAVSLDLALEGMPRERALAGGETVFDFPAKSGQRRVQSVRDRGAREAIEAMRRRRGGPDDLLAFRENREWRDVRSDDVNAYIQDRIGEEFSAKDFRTWSGTVLAATALAGEPAPKSDAAARRTIAAAVESVAAALGNTPAVCRRSYIDPRVFDRYRDGDTIAPLASKAEMSARVRSRVERSVLELIS
jgi:DNA topoisomerase IB